MGHETQNLRLSYLVLFVQFAVGLLASRLLRGPIPRSAGERPDLTFGAWTRGLRSGVPLIRDLRSSPQATRAEPRTQGGQRERASIMVVFGSTVRGWYDSSFLLKPLHASLGFTVTEKVSVALRYRAFSSMWKVSGASAPGPPCGSRRCGLGRSRSS